MPTVGCYIREDLHKRLQEIAKRKGVSVSSILKDCIRSYVYEHTQLMQTTAIATQPQARSQRDSLGELMETAKQYPVEASIAYWLARILS
ncbi:MAG: ribbon-helix-helix protein, CopG family [Syntrophobacteria bacterium]